MTTTSPNDTPSGVEDDWEHCELSLNSKKVDQLPTTITSTSTTNNAAPLNKNEAANEITKEKEFPDEEDQGHANHDANTIEKALEWLARTVKREYQDKPDKFDVYQSFKTLMEQVKSEQIELNDFLRRIKLNTPDEIILGLNELLPSGQQIDRKISLQPEPLQRPTGCDWKLPHLALIRLAGNDVVVPVQNQKDLTYSAKNENDDEETKSEAEDNLKKTLQEIKLSHIEGMLRELGACTSDDLLNLDQKMIVSLNLKPLEFRRFQNWKRRLIQSRHRRPGRFPAYNDDAGAMAGASSHAPLPAAGWRTPTLTKLIAVHNFAGDQPGDLPFAKGDCLYGIKLTGQWWTGVDSNDLTGTFPSNYVKVVGAQPTSPAATGRPKTVCGSSERLCSEMPTPAQYSICAIGDGNTGKTSIIRRYVDPNFDQEVVSNINVETFKDKECRLNTGQIVTLRIHDTAGQERYRSMTRSYYRDANSFLVVYDVCERTSFQNIEQWMEDIQQYGLVGTRCVLVGNKIDDEDNRQVSTEEGEQLADEYDMPFFETSAKSGKGVEEVFVRLSIEMSKMFPLGCKKSVLFFLKDQQPAAQNKKGCCGIM